MTILSAVTPPIVVAGETFLQWASALGIGLVIAEVVRSWVQRRKMGADAAKTITDAASLLIEPLRQRIKELEPLQQDVLNLRKELDDVHQQLDDTQKELVVALSEAEEAKREVTQLKRRMAAAEAFQSQKPFLRPYQDPDQA